MATGDPGGPILGPTSPTTGVGRAHQVNPKLYQSLVSHKLPWSIIKRMVDEDWVDLESTMERWPDAQAV